jgi:raffinose/stachyose/melibiose transport system permease protein
MKSRKIASLTTIYICLILALLAFSFPFFLLIVNSFKDNGQILENPFSLPTNIDFGHFGEVIEKMDFMTTFMNSFVITTASVLFILLFSSMGAHHIVRNNTKFNKVFFALLVASMIIPFQSIMIPLVYIYGAKLHLISSMPVALLIILYIGFGSAFSVFVYHGFIKSIPLELEEASQIDGCSKWQTFIKIVFPILSSTSVTIAILNILWIWNDYLLPSLVLNNEQNFTMPIKMKVFNGTYMNDWQLLIPAILMTILPILVFYIFGQKYIVKGVMQGAIK